MVVVVAPLFSQASYDSGYAPRRHDRGCRAIHQAWGLEGADTMAMASATSANFLDRARAATHGARSRLAALLVTTTLLASCAPSPAPAAAPTTPPAAAPAQATAAPPPSAAPTVAPTPAARSSAPVQEITYGVSTLTPELLPIWTAQDQGFDVKNGIKINVVNTEGGSKGLLVLVGGNFQAMDVGLAPSVIANSHGADVRIINSIANAIPFVFFGANGVTPANAAETLKGSKVGISAFGSESDVAATLFLNRLGLIRDKDVTVVQVGGGATRLAALESGAIGAAPLLGPEVLKAQDDGFAAVLDLASNSEWVFECSVLNKSFIDTHRDQAMALLKALIEGNYYSRANPTDAKRIMSAGLKYTDPRLVDASYDEYVRVVPLDLTPRDAGIREVINQVKSLPDTTLTTEDPNAYVDLSLLADLRAAGYFDTMLKTYTVRT